MDIVNELKLLELGPDEDRHVDLEIVFKRKTVYDKIAALFPTQKGPLPVRH